jgi:hypothetical protein
MTAEEETQRAIGKASYVQMGLVLVLLTGAYFTGKFQSNMTSEIASLKITLTQVQIQISAIEELIKIRTEARWTKDQMSLWVRALKTSNSDLNIPDVDNIPIRILD